MTPPLHDDVMSATMCQQLHTTLISDMKQRDANNKEARERIRQAATSQHLEVRNSLAEMSENIKGLTASILGNGRPGLRDTQYDVARLREDFEKDIVMLRAQLAEEKILREKQMQARDSWILTFLKPAIPLAYAAVLGYLLYTRQ